jgi:hypothetical protein
MPTLLRCAVNQDRSRSHPDHGNTPAALSERSESERSGVGGEERAGAQQVRREGHEGHVLGSPATSPLTPPNSRGTMGMSLVVPPIQTLAAWQDRRLQSDDYGFNESIESRFVQILRLVGDDALSDGSHRSGSRRLVRSIQSAPDWRPTRRDRPIRWDRRGR